MSAVDDTKRTASQVLDARNVLRRQRAVRTDRAVGCDVLALHDTTASAPERFMPRILPRLLKALEKTSLEPHRAAAVNPVIRKKRKASVPREAASFDWTEHGRTQSVLAGANPFMHKHLFRRRKALTPRVKLGVLNGEVSTSEDRAREMTEEEKGWHASPYRAHPLYLDSQDKTEADLLCSANA